MLFCNSSSLMAASNILTGFELHNRVSTVAQLATYNPSTGQGMNMIRSTLQLAVLHLLCNRTKPAAIEVYLASCFHCMQVYIYNQCHVYFQVCVIPRPRPNLRLSP